MAELSHVCLGVIGPLPVSLGLLRHGVWDRLVDSLVQGVRLVVELFHEPRRNGAQVLGLLHLFEVAKGSVQQDQAPGESDCKIKSAPLGGVAQDLVVFRAVDVASSGTRSRELQFVNHKDTLD